MVMRLNIELSLYFQAYAISSNLPIHNGICVHLLSLDAYFVNSLRMIMSTVSHDNVISLRTIMSIYYAHIYHIIVTSIL